MPRRGSTGIRIQGITDEATAMTPRICRNTCSETAGEMEHRTVRRHSNFTQRPSFLFKIKTHPLTLKMGSLNFLWNILSVSEIVCPHLNEVHEGPGHDRIQLTDVL